MTKAAFFLSYAKDELLYLKKIVKASTEDYLCSEVEEVFCSYFCGQAIYSFARQDLKLITSQKGAETIKDIQNFVADCCTLDLGEEKIKKAIMQTTIDCQNIGFIIRYIKELALAGFDYTTYLMGLVGGGQNLKKLVFFAKCPLAQITPTKFNKFLYDFTSPLLLNQQVFHLSHDDVKAVIKREILVNHSPKSIQKFAEELALTFPEPDSGTTWEEIYQLVDFYWDLLY